ncbi:unnamed protein product [Tenebrio molitor]|nr:unnamed protein product [Tenebrio molitor]
MCKWLWGFGGSAAKSSYGMNPNGSRKSSVADIPGSEQEAKVESPAESYRVTQNS